MKQIYCMLRDKIMLNKSVFLLSIDCRGCGLKDHLIENCERIHLVMNRDIKIRQSLYSKPILERKVFLRKRKKINCLKIVHKYFTSASIEGSFFQDEEKEVDPQTYDKISDFEIKEEDITSFNSKKEISYPSISHDQIDVKKEIMGSKKESNSISQSINETNYELRNPTKRSSKSINKEMSEIIFDKLRNYNYYYPDFNFEKIKMRMLTVKRKAAVSSMKRKKKHITLK